MRRGGQREGGAREGPARRRAYWRRGTPPPLLESRGRGRRRKRLWRREGGRGAIPYSYLYQANKSPHQMKKKKNSCSEQKIS